MSRTVSRRGEWCSRAAVTARSTAGAGWVSISRSIRTRLGLHPVPARQHVLDGQRGVVEHEAVHEAPKVAERRLDAVEQRLEPLDRVRLGEVRVGERQRRHQVLDLARHAGDVDPRLAEVDLHRRAGQHAAVHEGLLPRGGRPQPRDVPAHRPRRERSRRAAAGRPLEDATLAAYLGELHDQGRAPASAATAVAAACFRARLAGRPSPGRGTDGPGPSPATGGRPAVEAGGKRGRSGRRTSPPSSPPATSRASAAVASTP